MKRKKNRFLEKAALAFSLITMLGSDLDLGLYLNVAIDVYSSGRDILFYPLSLIFPVHDFIKDLIFYSFVFIPGFIFYGSQRNKMIACAIFGSLVFIVGVYLASNIIWAIGSYTGLGEFLSNKEGFWPSLIKAGLTLLGITLGANIFYGMLSCSFWYLAALAPSLAYKIVQTLQNKYTPKQFEQITFALEINVVGGQYILLKILGRDTCEKLFASNTKTDKRQYILDYIRLPDSKRQTNPTYPSSTFHGNKLSADSQPKFGKHSNTCLR